MVEMVVTAVPPVCQTYKKLLTASEVEYSRLNVPARSEVHLPNLQNGGDPHVNFEAVDVKDGKGWRLKYSRRPGRYSKPVISGDWSALVRHKEIRQGDRVTIFRRFNPHQYTILVERKIIIFGETIWGQI